MYSALHTAGEDADAGERRLHRAVDASEPPRKRPRSSPLRGASPVRARQGRPEALEGVARGGDRV